MSGVIPSKEYNEQIKKSVRETIRKTRFQTSHQGRWHKKGGGSSDCPEIHRFMTGGDVTGGVITWNYTILDVVDQVSWNWNATATDVAVAFIGHSAVTDSDWIQAAGGPWPNVAIYIKFTVSGESTINFPTINNETLAGGTGLMDKYSSPGLSSS